MVHIAVNGAVGRMGRCLIQAVKQTDGLVLSAAVDRAKSTLLGVDAGELVGVGKLNIAITDNIAAAAAVSDIIIDFTMPDVTMALLPHCVENECRLIIGTTGLSLEQKMKIKKDSKYIAMLLSPNMSIGVNLSLSLLDIAARVLGDEFDIETIKE